MDMRGADVVLKVPPFSSGQWKQCCDELMKIELPSPRKPAPVALKQGSLYHEMGKRPADVAVELEGVRSP